MPLDINKIKPILEKTGKYHITELYTIDELHDILTTLEYYYITTYQKQVYILSKKELLFGKFDNNKTWLEVLLFESNISIEINHILETDPHIFFEALLNNEHFGFNLLFSTYLLLNDQIISWPKYSGCCLSYLRYNYYKYKFDKNSFKIDYEKEKNIITFKYKDLLIFAIDIETIEDPKDRIFPILDLYKWILTISSKFIDFHTKERLSQELFEIFYNKYPIMIFAEGETEEMEGSDESNDIDRYLQKYKITVH